MELELVKQREEAREKERALREKKTGRGEGTERERIRGGESTEGVERERIGRQKG